MKELYASNEYYKDLVQFTANAAYDALLTGEDESEEAQLPPPLRNWLGRLRLLYGVPFAYLVPNEKLLPKESIRFYYIDRNWTDRLVDGALSVSKTTTREYAHHHAVNQLVREESDDEERYVRDYLRGRGSERGKGQGADLTGMLMRSRIVSGWPGLEVKAYKGGDSASHKLKLLRMDRLSPDIMLCIFNDIPTIVDVEEPREGIRFGVDLDAPDAPSGFELKLRYIHGPNAGWNVGHPKMPEPDGKSEVTTAVPVRKANRRVIHVKNLHAKLPGELSVAGVTGVGSDFSAADLAVQMLQFPYRQRFTGDKILEDDDTPEWILESTYAAATFQVSKVMAPLNEAELNKLFPQVDLGGGD
ncbi:MAG: hypothetical protein GY803_22385 [Chloroflexi bacterium]|nr:hypothetical protein [Chloroflexota bacterium]